MKKKPSTARRGWILGLMLVSLLAGLAGCAPAARAPASQVTVREAAVGRGDAAAPAEQPAAEEARALTSDQYAGDTARMVVRTANLTLIVTEASPSLDDVTRMATRMGGYVTDSNLWREGDQLRARVSLRIPAEQLDAALAEIKAIAVRVESESVTGQDVTAEFTDLQAQLTNLQATEVELRALLAEVREKTGKAEDILAVYRELTQIRGQIEQIQGRMKYLSNQTALATIIVELIPDILAKPVVEPGWRPLETLRNAGRALVNALKTLFDVLIWLVVYVLPLLIAIAIPIVVIVLLVRWLVRRKRRPAEGKQAPGK